MTHVPASLRPVSGHPTDLLAALRGWLADESAEALVVRTSGSSGRPKDVALSRTAVLASARATLDRLGGAGQWLLALPTNYVAGLQVLVRSIVGETTPVTLGVDADLASATAQLKEPRYTAVVPTQLHRWMSRPSDLAALRTFDGVLVGGGPVDSSLRRRAADAGIAVVSTYGMSETAGGCVYDGVPLDGVAVALGDEGEIRLAGPVLFDGYVGQPDLTASVLRDGWLHTPDLGRLRADGRLEVLGRSDDVVISGGVNVPLPAVEDRLATMPAVSACAVVAVADDEWGARIVAFVVAVDDRTPPPLAAVRDFVAQHLPRAWAPQQLVCVRSLPVLRSGKVDRQALMVRIGSGV